MKKKRENDSSKTPVLWFHVTPTIKYFGGAHFDPDIAHYIAHFIGWNYYSVEFVTKKSLKRIIKNYVRIR